MSPRNATEIGQRRAYTFRGEKYPSVTTLLKAWPMEWAIAFGAKHVAERAVFQFSHLQQLLDDVDMPIDSVLKWLKSAPAQRRDAAADHGTNVHEYLEYRLRGEPAEEWFMDGTDRDGSLTPAEVAVEQFIQTYRPDPLFVESQVFSLSEGYAGSADAFVTIYGKRYVLDLKTGGNTTTDHKARLQLAAYRYADFIGEDDREVAPVPVCDGALILSVPRDNPQSWQLIEVEAGPTEFRRFLDFKRAWLWYDAHKDTAIGELLLPQKGEAA